MVERNLFAIERGKVFIIMGGQLPGRRPLRSRDEVRDE
jgi:hypothetical protein